MKTECAKLIEERKAEIETMLKLISKAVKAESKDPNERNWGIAGDLGRVARLLSETCCALNIEGYKED